MAFDATRVTKDARAITPSTNAAVKQAFFGFYVGTGGDVMVLTMAGSKTTFLGVPTGDTIHVAIQAVYATNTTASDIVGFGPT